MIVNKSVYECPQCKEQYFFDTSTIYETICKKCQCDLNFVYNCDCDTEQAERIKNTPPYDPTKDINSPYYIPVIKCPYCSSTKTSKISSMSRVVSTGLFGLGSKKVGKQWHCNKCGADF